jgi:hypothetical protein
MLDRDRDNRCFGVTTSDAYEHRVKKSLQFGWAEVQYAILGGAFDVPIQC